MGADPMPERHAMTVAELLALPDDGTRRELIDGELHVMSPAGVRHGLVAARVLGLLLAFADARRLGYVTGAETGFVVREAPDTVRAPDVAFIPRADLTDPRSATGYGQPVPGLVVEVVSPADAVTAVTRKALDWLDAGVRLVWVVDPEIEAVTVYGPDRVVHLLTDDDVLDGGDVLPGLRLSLPAVFQDLRQS